MAHFKYKNVAFVLSLFDTGLAAIRNLGRLGVPVIGIDSNPQMPGFKSKYCVAKLCPDPVRQPEELLRFLLSEGQKLDCPGILLPASDAFVFFISRCREPLKTYFNFILPHSDVLEKIIDKHQQYELAKESGLMCPNVFFPATPKDLDNIKNRIIYPVFIKPYYTYLWRYYLPNKGFKVDSYQELVERFRTIWDTGLQAMVQSVIPGPSTNNFEMSSYICTTGKVLAIFTVRKVRQYPPDLGTATLVESVHFPELVNLGLRFLHNIHYRGVSNLEFKLDEQDGQLKFIEINARLWLQNDHATACGVNIPLMAYLDLIGQDPIPQLEFTEGNKWIDIISDFQSFWYFSRRGDLHFKNWLATWHGTKTFAIFTWDDPVPALHSIEYGLKFLRLPLYLFRHQRNYKYG